MATHGKSCQGNNTREGRTMRAMRGAAKEDQFGERRTTMLPQMPAGTTDCCSRDILARKMATDIALCFYPSSIRPFVIIDASTRAFLWPKRESGILFLFPLLFSTSFFFSYTLPCFMGRDRRALC